MSDYEKTVVGGESRMRILRLFILSLPGLQEAQYFVADALKLCSSLQNVTKEELEMEVEHSRITALYDIWWISSHTCNESSA
jgi:hypothetical protein